MATVTYHISMPEEIAKEIDKIMKEEHYGTSEFFKFLYRHYREQKDWRDTMKSLEEDKKKGKLKEMKHIDELFE